MKTQLILLTEPILVSDERAQEGFNYDFALKQVTKLHKTYETHTTEWNFCRKIIAGIPELPSIDFSALSEEDCKKIGWYPLEKAIAFAISKFDKLSDKHPSGGKVSIENIMDVLKVGVECGYKFGTKQSLNEKKFSEMDIWKAITLYELKQCENLNKGLKNVDATEIATTIIQSLSQPKIIDVEVEVEEKTNWVETNKGMTSTPINYLTPKITNKSIKVIKVL